MGNKKYVNVGFDPMRCLVGDESRRFMRRLVGDESRRFFFFDLRMFSTMSGVIALIDISPRSSS